MHNHVHPWTVAACLGLLGILAPRAALATEPAPQANVADLERRVRELEDLVRELRAERAAGGPTVNTLPQVAPPNAEPGTQPSPTPSPGAPSAEAGSSAPSAAGSGEGEGGKSGAEGSGGGGSRLQAGWTD